MNTEEIKLEPEVEVTSSEPIPPEIEAAKYLQGALPAFRRQLELVTGTQCKRVLAALAESPLENETPEFTTSEAEQLFTIGTLISNAKFILFQASYLFSIAKEVNKKYNLNITESELRDMVQASIKEQMEVEQSQKQTEGVSNGNS